MSQEFWDKNAKAWSQAIQEKRVASRTITNPAIIDAILKQAPKRVIDLGCGEGWIASELVPKGIDYFGLDFSEKLIKSARESHPSASFDALSYEDLIVGKWKTTKLADLVVFNFSLFEENLRPILRLAVSMVQPDGCILIQTLHPLSLTPYEDGWKIEDFQAFPVSFDGTMQWYGRTLSSWVRTLTESGLKIAEIIEPTDPVSKMPLSIIFSTTHAT